MAKEKKMSAAVQDLVTPVEHAKAQYDEMLEKASKKVQKVIASETKALFGAIPELESICWRQYTPSFNDGDPCVFQVHEPDYTFNVPITKKIGKYDPSSYDAGEELEGFGSEFYDKEKATLRNNLDEKPIDIDALNDYGRNFQQFTNDMLETAFGNGKQITITRDGFQIEDYYD